MFVHCNRSAGAGSGLDADLLDGLPLVTYHDPVARELRVARCANTLCISHFSRR